MKKKNIILLALTTTLIALTSSLILYKNAKNNNSKENKELTTNLYLVGDGNSKNSSNLSVYQDNKIVELGNVNSKDMQFLDKLNSYVYLKEDSKTPTTKHLIVKSKETNNEKIIYTGAISDLKVTKNGYALFNENSKSVTLNIETKEKNSSDGTYIHLPLYQNDKFIIHWDNDKIIMHNFETKNTTTISEEYLTSSLNTKDNQLVIIDDTGIVKYIDLSNGEVKTDKNSIYINKNTKYSDSNSVKSHINKNGELIVFNHEFIISKKEDELPITLIKNINQPHIYKNKIYFNDNSTNGNLTYIDLDELNIPKKLLDKNIIPSTLRYTNEKYYGVENIENGTALYEFNTDGKATLLAKNPIITNLTKGGMAYTIETSNSKDNSLNYSLYLNNTLVANDLVFATSYNDNILYINTKNEAFIIDKETPTKLNIVTSDYDFINLSESLAYNPGTSDFYHHAITLDSIDGYYEVKSESDSLSYVKITKNTISEFRKYKDGSITTNFSPFTVHADFINPSKNFEYKINQNTEVSTFTKIDSTTMKDSNPNFDKQAPPRIFKRITESEYKKGTSKLLSKDTAFEVIARNYFNIFNTLEKDPTIEKTITINNEKYKIIKSNETDEKVLINCFGQTYNYNTYKKSKELIEDNGNLYN